MAIRGAVASGNWNDVATWDGGVSLPVSGDTVVANGFTVTIDVDLDIGTGTIQTLAAGAFASGGVFTNNTAKRITANLLAGTTECVTVTGTSNGNWIINGNLTGSAASSVAALSWQPTGSGTNTLVVSGDLTSGAGGAAARAITLGSSPTRTITVNGNVSASAAHALAISISSHNVTVNGSVTGSLTTASIYGISLTSAGSVTVNGSVTGGSATTSHGIRNAGSGSITVTGNVLGGSSTGEGINITSTSDCTVTGNVTSSATAYGISNSSTGTIKVTGTVTAAAFGPGIKRTSASDQKTIINGSIVGETSVGWPGVICGQLGKIVIGATTAQSHTYATDNAGAIGALRTLSTPIFGGTVVRAASNY